MQQLSASAQSVQKDRTALADDLNKLKAELERAEQRTAAKQKEYLEARKASQGLADRFKDLECECLPLCVCAQVMSWKRSSCLA